MYTDLRWRLKRDPNSNSSKNKLLPKDRVRQLSQCVVDGYEWVCVDETRFDVGYARVKGWSKKGKHLYIHRKKRGFSCSGITAIGDNGMQHCVLVRGKVIAEIYDSFLDHLAEEFKNEGQVVFWMDNAKIHEHDTEKFKKSKYKMLLVGIYDYYHHGELEYDVLWQTDGKHSILIKKNSTQPCKSSNA